MMPTRKQRDHFLQQVTDLLARDLRPRTIAVASPRKEEFEIAATWIKKEFEDAVAISYAVTMDATDNWAEGRFIQLEDGQAVESDTAVDVNTRRPGPATGCGGPGPSPSGGKRNRSPSSSPSPFAGPFSKKQKHPIRGKHTQMPSVGHPSANAPSDLDAASSSPIVTSGALNSKAAQADGAPSHKASTSEPQTGSSDKENASPTMVEKVAKDTRLKMSKTARLRL